MPWEMLEGAAGAGVPQAETGFDVPSLDLHPWAGKASPGSWHLLGVNSAELLGGFLPRQAAGSMRLEQGENTRGTSQRARETVLGAGVCCWVVKISPSHPCAPSVPPPGATSSEHPLLSLLQ